ncbi:MAG: SDR family oxidoreductase [Cytophagales bacterium]|nr:SDR family oxidoreductase [Cytophagales bacterium]
MTKNKPLVIITGASSGIGAATAKLFAEQGFPMLLLARRVEKIEALNLPNAICRKVDVTDYDALNKAIKEAEEKYGQADLIVNNAGVMLMGDLATQNREEWKQMFDVNILGLMNGMQAVLPQMRERNGGTIVNISSVAGRKSFGNHAAYCGTKFGVHAITETAREENADANVRMVVVAPGAVETELLSHTTSKEIIAGYEAWKESMGGTVLSAEDIANAVWYAYNQPQGVNVREIVLAATRQQP